MKEIKLKIDKRFETKFIIKKELELDSDIKRNLITKQFKSGSKTTYFYMYEEYYKRTNSDLTVTLFVLETPDFTEIEMYSSGGGVGISSSSFGSEAASLKAFKKLFIEEGFYVVE